MQRVRGVRYFLAIMLGLSLEGMEQEMAWVFHKLPCVLADIVVQYLEPEKACELGKHALGLICSIDWSPCGSYLVSAGDDRTIKLWNVASKTELRILDRPQYKIKAVRWHPHGAYLASASEDATIKVWEHSTGEVFRRLRGHEGGVLSLDWSPCGSYLVSGSRDATIKAWSLSSGKEICTCRGHTVAVSSVAHRPGNGSDGIVVSASIDGSVKCWNLATGEVVHTLQMFKERFPNKPLWNSLAWHPDGSCVAAISSSSTISIWDFQQGRLLRTIYGDNTFLTSVAWSLDGFRLATASLSNVIKFWDTKTGELSHTFEDCQWVRRKAAYSPCGFLLASISNHKKIELWKVASLSALVTAARTAYAAGLDGAAVRTILNLPEKERAAAIIRMTQCVKH